MTSGSTAAVRAASAPRSRARARQRRLLPFYDRLRERALRAAADGHPRFGKRVAEALLLVPDVFVLLVRLTFDQRVPADSRALIGGALAYFLLPVDLFPEAFVGFGGYLDDLVLAAAVLSHALGEELEPFAHRYWNGSRELRATLRDIAASAQLLLGRNLYRRLKQALSKRGIEVRS